MANFYIMEGPDGAGKSTLARQIADAHPGCLIQHFGKPETEEARDYFKTYLRVVKKHEIKETVIMDRCWYSDMVYGPALRGREEMTVDNMEMLELAVKACGGGVIFYCTGKLEVLWKRCKARGENLVTSIEKLSEIRDRYEDVMKLPKYLPVIRYDTTVRW